MRSPVAPITTAKPSAPTSPGTALPGVRQRVEPDPFEKFVDYVTVRLTEDPHLWAVMLLDELRLLGFTGSYPTLTRQGYLERADWDETEDGPAGQTVTVDQDTGCSFPSYPQPALPLLLSRCCNGRCLKSKIELAQSASQVMGSSEQQRESSGSRCYLRNCARLYFLTSRQRQNGIMTGRASRGNDRTI